MEALIMKYTAAMLEGPLPSVTVRAKFWKEPEPEAGRVETTTGGPEAGTVQVPVVTQPLYWTALSWAKPKVLLPPLKAKAKLSGKLRVRVLPLVETEAPAALSVHRLLETVAEAPRVIGPWKAEPASFIRYKKLAARLKETKQLLAAEMEALTMKYTAAMLEGSVFTFV